MDDIEDLQRRILAAIDRIGAGVGTLSEQAASGGNAAELEQALEDERLANGQLEERLRALRSKHDDDMAALRAELDRSAEIEQLTGQLQDQTRVMERLDMDLQRVRAANDQLRLSNAALREANQNGVGEPHLINKAMLAELEGLRAVRAADMAEATAVLARLEPMLAAAETEGS